MKIIDYNLTFIKLLQSKQEKPKTKHFSIDNTAIVNTVITANTVTPHSNPSFFFFKSVFGADNAPKI